MSLLILGLVLFFATHAIAFAAPATRIALRSRLGDGGYRAAYSLVAAVGLVLIVYGYGLGRQAPVLLWDPPVATRHIAATLMIFVFPLLFAAYLPGRIKAATKHPMLAAVKIWAFAHLIANGTLADVVLFGAFLAWAVVDRISMKRRPAATAVAGSVTNDVIAVVLGLVVYAAFLLWLHVWLFAVDPLG